MIILAAGDRRRGVKTLVLALESFSGERERNTLETLFATPLRESEIYMGKIFAVLLPSLALSYSALVVYTIGVLLIDAGRIVCEP